MHQSALLLAVGEGVILVLGAVLVGVAYRAYRRTGDRPLRWLAVGFGLITAGVLASALLHGAGLDRPESLLVERGFTVAGLAAVVHSVVGRVRDDRPGRNTP